MNTVVKLARSDYPLGIQRLFYDRYDCRVPAIALRTNESLRMRGVYAVDGDEYINAHIHHAEVETSLTINHIFEVWRAGYAPIIKDARKTLEIFNAVVDHLSQWVDYLSYGVQHESIPFDDLIQLDQFADKIYEHSRHERVKRNIQYFSNNIQAGLGFNLTPGAQLASVRFSAGLINQPGYITNPESIAKEEREKYSDEFMRLGGRLSPELRRSEREALFSRGGDK